MPKTHRHRLPNPDSRGRIRPCVGRLPNGKEARFSVGDRRTSPVEAQRRLDMIRSLYEAQCQHHQVDHWMEWTRRIAMKIAANEPVVDTCVGSDQPLHLAAVVLQLEAWGIPVQRTSGNLSKGIEMYAAEIESLIQNAVAMELEKLRQQRGAIVDSVTLPRNPLVMAERAAVAAPEEIAQFAKREMGCKVYQKAIHGEHLPPEIIQSYVLDKLRKDATLKLGEFHSDSQPKSSHGTTVVGQIVSNHAPRIRPG